MEASGHVHCTVDARETEEAEEFVEDAMTTNATQKSRGCKSLKRQQK